VKDLKFALSSTADRGAPSVKGIQPLASHCEMSGGSALKSNVTLSWQAIYSTSAKTGGAQDGPLRLCKAIGQNQPKDWANAETTPLNLVGFGKMRAGPTSIHGPITPSSPPPG
jgi:hypothetical protein